MMAKGCETSQELRQMSFIEFRPKTAHIIRENTSFLDDEIYERLLDVLNAFIVYKREMLFLMRAYFKSSGVNRAV